MELKTSQSMLILIFYSRCIILLLRIYHIRLFVLMHEPLKFLIPDHCNCQAAECLKEKFHLSDSVWMRSLGHENTYSFQENTLSIQQPDQNVGYSMASGSISGNFCALSSVLKSLVLLQDIYSMLSACQDIEHIDGKIFFSSLDAVSTTSDCVLRKLRELLMVVSLDCTKCELLGEGNGMPNTKNQKEKLASNDHKKRGKNRNMKRPKTMTRSSVDDTKFVKGTKVPLHTCRPF